MNPVYLYWLTTIEGIGVKRIRQILEYFGTAENAWIGTSKEYKNIKGIREDIIDKIIKKKDYDKLLNEIEGFMSKGIRMAAIDSSEYPGRLKNIYDPPYILYMKGEYRECTKYIAIVGSRKCSSYGRIAARNISKQLAEVDIGIISGLARGIDTEAHRGALEGSGFTCSVLGCGCDIVYPPENRKLMMEIEENGAVITEYPPGTAPSSFNFPARNRIISGLSDGVLIVEADEKSGALITANYALEQGRDVFAVPGSIFSNMSRGTNSLIKDGAKLVSGIEDILDEFGLEYKDGGRDDGCSISEREQKVLSIVGDCPLYIDDLARKTSYKVNEVNSILTALELKGVVRVLPGKFVVKIS